MDIKYFSICEWVDRDLMLLERIDTKLNLSDHLTKGLTRALFHRGTLISSLATSLRPTLPSIQPLSGPTRTHSSTSIVLWNDHGLYNP